MNDATRKLYLLMTLVVSAIVFTAFIAVIFNFIRTFTTPPSCLSSLMLVIIISTFTCILILFTSALYVLVLMLGFAELRSQLHDFKLKREQSQQKMSSLPARASQTPGAMPIRHRQSSRY